MTEALIEAVTDLASSPPFTSDDLLLKLRHEEENHYQLMKNKSFSERYVEQFESIRAIQPNFDLFSLFRSPSVCHTAILPSMTRYLGYLTNTDQIGGPAPFGGESYDVGIEHKEALDNPGINGDSIRLVYSEAMRFECNLTVAPDYKDYFLVTSKDGWSKLAFPNQAEREAYSYDSTQVKGIVFLILKKCPWGKCEEGSMNPQSFNERKWEMKINGEAVVSLHVVGRMLLARRKSGIYFKPNQNGIFDIEIKVNHKDSFVEISSFVIY